MLLFDLLIQVIKNDKNEYSRTMRFSYACFYFMFYPFNTAFVGFCISRNADCGNKVVWKTGAHEQVGVMALRDGKPCIVEYSDIDTDTAEQRDPNTGKLLYGAGNICNHFFTVDFLRDVVLPNMNAMYHMARKKIPFYDSEKNQTVTPTTNNGVKLESFIFDVFPLSDRMAIYEVKRNEEFAPVKNAPGSPADSPDSARQMISDQALRWVTRAGIILHNGDRKERTDYNNLCEISPLVSYAGEGIEEQLKGQEIVCPFNLEISNYP
jgi:UDP-N-acetylglucosamine/UDP-N-acetylgalactosamine diphosphorylase